MAEYTLDQLKDQLYPSREMVVSFGAHGSQRCRFVRWRVGRMGHYTLVVQKFRAKSKQWTKDVVIHHTEVKEVL